MQMEMGTIMGQSLGPGLVTHYEPRSKLGTFMRHGLDLQTQIAFSLEFQGKKMIVMTKEPTLGYG